MSVRTTGNSWNIYNHFQEVLAAYTQFVSLPLLQPAVIAFGFSAAGIFLKLCKLL